MVTQLATPTVAALHQPPPFLQHKLYSLSTCIDTFTEIVTPSTKRRYIVAFFATADEANTNLALRSENFTAHLGHTLVIVATSQMQSEI